MKKGLVIIVLALAVPSLAQTAQPPRPGPEIQKLDHMIGTWKSEGQAKASPFGPGGKTAARETCDWFAGAFHVVCRGEGTGPEGKMTYLSILAYDAVAKAYTYYGITSQGEIESSKGSLAGNTWTWLWEAKMAGKPVKGRITVVEVSPTAYTFTYESSVAGGPWTVTEEGKATKVK